MKTIVVTIAAYVVVAGVSVGGFDSATENSAVGSIVIAVDAFDYGYAVEISAVEFAFARLFFAVTKE